MLVLMSGIPTPHPCGESAKRVSACLTCLPKYVRTLVKTRALACVVSLELECKYQKISEYQYITKFIYQFVEYQAVYCFNVSYRIINLYLSKWDKIMVP